MINNPNGCDLSRLRMGARRALWYLELQYAIDEEVFTLFHTNDGLHMEGSLHFKNRAIDFDAPKKDPVGKMRRWKAALGPDYDLVDSGECWHLEHDPK